MLYSFRVAPVKEEADVMSGTIFAVDNNGMLIEMTEQPYNSEDLLQSLLATHPKLLAGDQINAFAPRRWLFISRETPIPDAQGGSGRWALDHLLLDQDAIPTFVEVKRSSDTRIRREVVGQMLDYAANAVVYWSVEMIQAQFEANCRLENRDPHVVLVDFLGPDADTDEFWQQARTNLQAGKVRLLFVADEIPPELRRIVEFLNEQMNPAEVLAVEIKQFVGTGLRTLVPRVLGQTIAAQQVKTGTPKPSNKWSEESFFQALAATSQPETISIAKRIMEWSTQNVNYVWWGEGTELGSFVPIVLHNKKKHQLFAVFTSGVIDIYFRWYSYKSPFDDESMRNELRQKLNGIPQVSIPFEAITKQPSIPLRFLQNEQDLQTFFDSFSWMISKIRAS